MSEGYSIEIADELVGIIVRAPDERVFRFHSAVKDYRALMATALRVPKSPSAPCATYARRRRLAAR